MKKIVISIFLIGIMILANSFMAFAATDGNALDKGPQKEKIKMYVDPKDYADRVNVIVKDKTANKELKQVKSLEEAMATPGKNVKVNINDVEKVYDPNTGEITETADVEVLFEDANPMKDGGATVTDGIRLTSNMTYTVSGKNVSMTKVSGTYTNIGLYYYTDPHVVYSNSSGTYRTSKTPTSSSWSYNPNSGYVAYLPDLPPFVNSWATCNVAGMSGGEYEVECLFTLVL